MSLSRFMWIGVAVALAIGGLAFAEDAKLKTADDDGRGVAYVDTGAPKGDGADATPIVLVHGWASDHRAWFKQVETLADDRRLLIVDLPGHGGSDDLSGEHTMSAYADAIAAVLDDAKVKEAVIVGHSNGAPVVRVFAIEHADRTAAVVAVDGLLADAFPAGLREQFRELMNSPNGPAMLRAQVQQLTSTMKRKEDGARIREMFEDQTERARLQGMLASMDPAIFDGGPIEGPVLVIEAPNPMLWTDEYHAKIADQSEDLVIKRMEGVSHFVMVDDAETFNGLVLTFIEERGL